MNDNFIKDTAELGARASAAEIIKIANIANLPGVPETVPAALIRGDTPQILPIMHVLDAYRLLPARKTGTAYASTLSSFAELVNRHKTAHSVIFANTDWRAPSLTSIINYHRCGDDNGLADHLDHKVVYNFPLSDEWKIWKDLDGQTMQQSSFASFIEDRIVDLAEPNDAEAEFAAALSATTVATPAKMIELSRGLAIRVDQEIKQSTTLQSGEGQISWVESHNGADGKPLKVPGLFIIRIAPFVGGDIIRTPAWLRYRVKGGSAVWHYQMYRPDNSILQVVTAAMEKVKKATGLPIYEGTPEGTPEVKD